MSNDNTSTLKSLILPVAVKYGIERIFLFGSMARGDADENSDYGFLISKSLFSIF